MGGSRPASPGAVLFDLDGTLVDSAQGIARALNGVRSARGAAPISAAQVAPWISLGAGELVRLGLGSVARDEVEDLSTFRRVLGGLRQDPSAVYPGVSQTLSGLIHAGWLLAVVSNKPEALCRALIQDVGMEGVFPHVVGGDTTDHAKPHAAPVRHALSALGVPAEEAVLIGDSEIDAAAANAAGVRFILYEGGYGRAACETSGFPIHGRLSEFDPETALRLIVGPGAAGG